nr:rod-binding protein [uncultured Niameybacter sp.]
MDISSINLGNTLTSQLQLQKVQGEGKDFETVLSEAVENKDDKALKEACKEIEQYMLSSIFKQMKASTQTGERLIEKGDYEEMFEDYLVDEQCKTMCEAGGVGLADMMYKQLSNTYGAQQNYKK